MEENRKILLAMLIPLEVTTMNIFIICVINLGIKLIILKGDFILMHHMYLKLLFWKKIMCIQLIRFHRIDSRQITVAGDMIF